jgi:putative DNA primase/helicase
VLEHALDWANRGWQVFPVKAGTKVPHIKEWQNAATSNHDQIRAWWGRWPDANIGGKCGDQWLVVDVDVKEGKQGAESYEALQIDHAPFPPTRRHSTPSGGWHLVYRIPSNWAATKMSNLPGYPGVDIQVGGAYVVLPPSQLPAGSYEVVEDLVEAEGPIWLQSARLGTTGRGQNQPQIAPANSLSTDTVMMQRDNQLYRFASKMRREGHSAKAVAGQLRAMASDETMYPYHGPKPDHDIDRIVKSAFRHPASLFEGISASISTDRDNGTLLATLSSGEVLWDDQLKCWFEWTGSRWRKSGYRLGLLTDEAVEALWSTWHQFEPGSKESKDILRRIEDFSTWGRLIASWNFLKYQVWADSNAWDDRPELLNCSNGTLNLTTGELRDHRPADRITMLTGCAYEPDADMSAWLEFVDWCFKGDPEQVRWAQFVFGQALIGRVDRALLVFLYGTGANGKSTFMDVLRTVLNDYAYEAPVDLVAHKGRESLHDEYVMALRGKRLITCPEPAQGVHWNDGRVKNLSGGDTIVSRPLYGTPVSFKVQGLLVVHGNNQPELRDRTEGMRRRMKLVPFDNHRPDAEQDSSLSRKLAGPGVLRWLVEGAQLSLRQPDLPGCARVAEATGSYLTDGNQLGRFAAECLVFDQDAWVSSADMYAVYRSWCLAEGEVFKESAQHLFNQLKLAYRVRPRLRELKGKRMRGWQGVGLHSDVVVQGES